MAELTPHKKQIDWLRKQGEHDARQGKPISAFYDLAVKPRHKESFRAAYEIGWKSVPKCTCDRPQMRCPLHDMAFGDTEI